MKSILLASTALVAFAGAAAADGHTSITHTLSTTLGYNDTDSNDGRVDGDGAAADWDNETGFYWEGNLKTTAMATLDNGLKAGAYFEITVAEDNDTANDDGGIDLSSSDFVLSLEASNGGLFFGDTGRAAEKYWKSAGDMEADGVSTGSDSAVLRGDIAAGPVKASISTIIDEDNDREEQWSFGAEVDAGVAVITAAYQEETDFADGDGDFNADEIWGLSAQGTFGGATVTVAYAENTTDDQQSTGIKVAYPFGPVTATAYYVDEQGGANDGEPNFGVNVAYADGPIGVTADYQDDQGTQKWKLEGSYDVGNGLTLFAGALDETEDEADYFVAAKYDLGGGADFTISYAEDKDGGAEDEIGSDEYQEGTTVELNFSF